ncbi:MAG: universal stress protein [Deltaproteobacteria bacterium]|nr:universal stress protein [Deltaproteobacteria bacterium]
MTKTSKILVPVDFSEPSKAALAWAFDYASCRPSELHVLHVVERHLQLSDLSADFDELKSELEAIKAQAEKQLGTLADEKKTSVGPILQHVATGKPAAEIVKVAGDVRADVIVMGTHGLKGVERMIIGSVAEQVVRKAKCAVVTVKA